MNGGRKKLELIKASRGTTLEWEKRGWRAAESIEWIIEHLKTIKVKDALWGQLTKRFDKIQWDGYPEKSLVNSPKNGIASTY